MRRSLRCEISAYSHPMQPQETSAKRPLPHFTATRLNPIAHGCPGFAGATMGTGPKTFNPEAGCIKRQTRMMQPLRGWGVVSNGSQGSLVPRQSRACGTLTRERHSAFILQRLPSRLREFLMWDSQGYPGIAWAALGYASNNGSWLRSGLEASHALDKSMIDDGSRPIP